MADNLAMELAGMDYLWVVLASVIAFVLGFLWYGPIFGKKWGGLMGMKMDEKPEMKNMLGSMGMNALGNLLTAYVLVFSIGAWIPSIWAAHLETTAIDSAPWFYALNATIFIWLGFFVPMQLNRVAWHERSWKLVAIDGSYDLVRLGAMSFFIAYMIF